MGGQERRTWTPPIHAELQVTSGNEAVSEAAQVIELPDAEEPTVRTDWPESSGGPCGCQT